MLIPSIYTQFVDELNNLRQTDNFRQLRELTHDGNHVWLGGRRLYNLSSNDYMGIGAMAGLSNNGSPTVGTYQSDIVEQPNALSAAGSCSSRLLTGNHSSYRKLESLLCELYQSEGALVFNSGYHANIGILPTLTEKNDLILADKLIHASLIDGIRLSDAKCVRFPHNDIEFLERILRDTRARYDRVFIAVESIYSMDGDVAPLKRLVELKQAHNCFLYVDEAHAIGTHGMNGLGLSEQEGVLRDIDILLGTFGKAIAGQGAFIITRSVIREYLINRCRSLIFTTALPAQSVEWAYRVMRTIQSMGEKRAHLATCATQLREGINRIGWKSGGETHIVPLITGDIGHAIRISNRLADNGYLALPIRRPTVPAGGERIRFSLTANTTNKQINEIISLCKLIG